MHTGQYSQYSMMVLVAETVHLQFLIMMMITAAAVLDGR